MDGIQVVDTHALVWFLTGDARLGDAAKAVLVHPDSNRDRACRSLLDDRERKNAADR